MAVEYCVIFDRGRRECVGDEGSLGLFTSGKGMYLGELLRTKAMVL